MSVEIPKAKSRLKNIIAYSVRASQAVLQYQNMKKSLSERK